MIAPAYLRIGQIAALTLAFSATAIFEVAAQETAKELLAIQIRDQGQRCEKPVSAKRDAKRSKPDAAVWVLRCEHRSYG